MNGRSKWTLFLALLASFWWGRTMIVEDCIVVHPSQDIYILENTITNIHDQGWDFLSLLIIYNILPSIASFQWLILFLINIFSFYPILLPNYSLTKINQNLYRSCKEDKVWVEYQTREGNNYLINSYSCWIFHPFSGYGTWLLDRNLVGSQIEEPTLLS